jgi:hypothetical protein
MGFEGLRESEKRRRGEKGKRGRGESRIERLREENTG